MPELITRDAVVAAGGTFTPMHRLTDDAGSLLVQADIESISYSIFEEGPRGLSAAVEGHAAVDLVVADTIYDAIQTGAPWTEDATGYNFRHTIAVKTHDAFADWGSRYMVVFRVELTAGPPIVWKWEVTT